jgi:hypothetical protein
LSADRDPIDDLLASISDGRPVDWEAVARVSSSAERARLTALRDIARIAEFNRGLQAGGEEAAAPARWGDLLLLERIGSGAQAEVFRAWDPGLQREVALKLLRPGIEGASLLEEGRAAARIRHAHVVTVHGIDRRDGRVGLWMELVRGVDLERQVGGHGPLAPPDAARLGAHAGAALAAVHAAGLLHRDVKPANVVRDAEGRDVLADFGLGLRWDASTLGAARASGTPMYMAPELLAGGAATERSDIYSLGALVWFALTGRHLFEVGSLEELLRAAARGPRPTLCEIRPDVPLALAAIVERAMAPEPGARYARAQEAVEALEAWTRAHARAATTAPAPVGRGRRWAAIAGVVALTVIAAFGAWSVRRPPATAPARVPAPVAVVPPVVTYAVEASLIRRDESGIARLLPGDRVRPGDRLSLEFRATRPAWVYVLNEDERGERYLLFPQPLFDVRNPIAADSTIVLPGTIGGRENAWSVTSAGGREHFLIVASPEPVAELEAELDRLPSPEPGRPVRYAAVEEATVERLRGVGGVVALPERAASPAPRAVAFDRFRALAGRESDVRGVWVRQVILENPGR